MSCPYHDAIIAAFAAYEAHETNCNRGHLTDGYTHIHAPGTTPHATRCNNHLVTVEKTNGTVSVFEPVAKALGAMARQELPIAKHPLGHSSGQSFGKFGFGFDVATILRRWGTFDAFATSVILVANQVGRWW